MNKKVLNKQEIKNLITEKLPILVDFDSTMVITDKYPNIVTVYSIGDISHELCGGPHVKNTSELGTFKIKKEEASSAGVRRIKAILE